MRKAFLTAVAAIIVVSPVQAIAKKQPELTSLQVQQLQARDIEAPKDLVFAAVMTILQDSGYRIQAADKDTGLISGIASSKGKLTWAPFVGFGKSKKTPIVSAFLEEYGPNMTRVRLSFVMAKIKSSMYGSQPQDEEPIYDAQIYQDAFEQLNQNVFLRQSMNAVEKPVGQSSAVAPLPVAAQATAVQEKPAIAHTTSQAVTPSAVTCTTCRK